MVSSTGVCFLFLVYFLQFCRFFCVFFLSFYIILGRKGVETNHPSSTWTATRLGEQCKGSYFHRTFYTRDQRPLAAWSGTQNSPGWVRLKTIFTELIKAGQLSETRKKREGVFSTRFSKVGNCGIRLPMRLRGRWWLLIRTWLPCRAHFSQLSSSMYASDALAPCTEIGLITKLSCGSSSIRLFRFQAWAPS